MGGLKLDSASAALEYRIQCIYAFCPCVSFLVKIIFEEDRIMRKRLLRAMKASYEEMYQDTKMIREKRKEKRKKM